MAAAKSSRVGADTGRSNQIKLGVAGVALLTAVIIVVVTMRSKSANEEMVGEIEMLYTMQCDACQQTWQMTGAEYATALQKIETGEGLPCPSCGAMKGRKETVSVEGKMELPVGSESRGEPAPEESTDFTETTEPDQPKVKRPSRAFAPPQP